MTFELMKDIKELENDRTFVDYNFIDFLDSWGNPYISIEDFLTSNNENTKGAIPLSTTTFNKLTYIGLKSTFLLKEKENDR